MTVEEKVYAVLAANAGVIALVPASRIKPATANLQGLARPYIFHHTVNMSTTYTHSGLTDFRSFDFYQINCVGGGDDAGTALSKAKEVAVAVTAALGSYVDADATFFLRDQQTLPPDDDVRIQGIALVFQIIGGLT